MEGFSSVPIKKYVKEIANRYSSGISTEHSYRGDLQNLLKQLVSGIIVTNEPKRQKCGAPDYIIQRKENPIGYIEAKDIGIDLNKIEKTDQLKRYLGSLDNLILTDYIKFRFYQYGDKVKEIIIASIENGKIIPIQNNFDSFILHLKSFCSFKGQTIKSAEKLAKIMAQKSRMMEEVLFNAIIDKDEDNTLRQQLKAFRQILIHDLDEKTFSDIYSQTIAYGLFAARLHDTTLETFSRQKARELIPKSNPFLRNLFDYVSGAQLDERVIWIVDDLADIFKATDLRSILTDFGKFTGRNDPFLHFYETFLAEYNPKLRKSRGVYYTPEPVVNFIVRAVDDILKNEFNLSQGLADTKKIKMKYATAKRDKRSKNGFRHAEKEIHKVQILDPATGTGTFLAEIIKQIYNKFKGQKGLWSKYVEDHLISRLNGFEILMAPYAMCHLKLEMLLKETGYIPRKDHKRIRVYLTNSLEEAHPDSGTLFATWLSNEATAANYVKENTPVMVVIGNPPYSGASKNKGQWIMGLMKDYKKEPGGTEKLKERNPKWINDDYMKFIRYGQHFIDKNKRGVLAFITPHGILDNPTFRGVRWNLLRTYDKIFTIDLHGNSKKKEVCPDGSPDDNVFDIQQGVSINLFIKTGKKQKNELGKVYHYDLYGKRGEKYDFLWKNSLRSISFLELGNVAPNYFFVRKDFASQRKYDRGFKINELMKINVLGYQTHRDKFAVDSDINKLRKRLKDFISTEISDTELKNKYKINESNSWQLAKQREKFRKENDYEKYITQTAYRPFDNQYSILNSIICDRPRTEIIKHVLNKDNYCLLSSRQQAVEGFRHCFITNLPANDCVMSTTSREANQIFPLFVYPDRENLKNNNREPNLDEKIVMAMAKKLKLTFTSEKGDNKSSFGPIDILDYIYAVLHSPAYREKYKEFLKIDFPRIPYPIKRKIFWKLVKLGSELRQIHLLESPKVEQYKTSYPKDGSNVVDKLRFENSKVWINKTQYFDKIPTIAWEFYIGGYRPAQKWLKDRKGRELLVEDLLHYQKIIVALIETERLMKDIDKIIKL